MYEYIRRKRLLNEKAVQETEKIICPIFVFSKISCIFAPEIRNNIAEWSSW